MPRTALLPLLALVLAACSARPSSVKSSWDSTRLMIAGVTIERAVEQHAMVNDKLLHGRNLYSPRFLSRPDGKGGGYIAMSAAFGGVKSMGPRHTWLYHVRGNNLKWLFRYPFDATEMKGKKDPVIRGDYWAYECTTCDDPAMGYMQKIPVRVSRKGKGWKIATELPAKDRKRLGHEARLIVRSAMAKYGEDDPQALRMEKQIQKLMPVRSGRRRLTSTGESPRRQIARQPSDQVGAAVSR